MKCEIIQRRLLSIPDPERMPNHLRAHLAYCGACREWHDHLLLLERHIPLLPVPRSNGKRELMRRLLQEQAPRERGDMGPKSRPDAPTLSHSHSATLLHSRTLLLGVAAALLLIALGWLGLQRWFQTTAASPTGEPSAGLAGFITALAPFSGARNGDVPPTTAKSATEHVPEPLKE
jgi:hypothetical protein